MKTSILTLRPSAPDSIDLSRLRMEDLIEQSDWDISQLSLPTSSGKLSLGEIFDVKHRLRDKSPPTLLLRGSCENVHSLGHQHRVGMIRVEGNIGDYCGACMSSGTIRVEGNAGNHLAAPTGSRGVGMSGGLLTVLGSTGDFAGHRMRRGEIRIAGNTGKNLASWQIAGTICVGGSTGDNVAYGMKRGTLVLSNPVPLPSNRFTTAVPLQTPFQTILLNRPDLQRDLPFLDQPTHSRKWSTRRGDRSIGGLGEIWIPENHS